MTGFNYFSGWGGWGGVVNKNYASKCPYPLLQFPHSYSPSGYSWAALWNKSILIKVRSQTNLKLSIGLHRHGMQFRNTWNFDMTNRDKAISPEHTADLVLRLLQVLTVDSSVWFLCCLHFPKRSHKDIQCNIPTPYSKTDPRI